MADEATTQGLVLSKNPRLKKIQLEEAKAQKDLVVAAAKKAEAELAKAAEEEPKAEDKPKDEAKSKAPEGKIEVGDDVGLVADLIAHSMLDEAAAKLCEEIKGELSKASSRVLLVDDPDLIASDWPYMAISRQIEQEKSGLEAAKNLLEEQLEEEPQRRSALESQEQTTQRKALDIGASTAAVAGLTGLVGGVADLVSMFRGDYAIKARKVSIGSAPLFAAIASKLIPEANAVNLDKLSLLEDSPLFQAFNEAAALRLEVQQLATEAKELDLGPVDWLVERAKEAQDDYVTALQAKAADAPDPDNLKVLKEIAENLAGEVEAKFNAVAEPRANVAVAEGAIERFDAFATAIVKAPKSGYPPLVAAAIREALHAGENGYTHVLYADVEAAGGETITRRTIFRTTARFLGGAQVSYMLWDVEQGRLAAANTMPVLGHAKFGLWLGFAEPVESIDLKGC